MVIYVYSDESGVFDKYHNDYFVFGGIILLSKKDKDIANRKFLHAERSLRSNGSHCKKDELKACKLSPKEKGKLLRSLNNYIKFGVVVHQKKVIEQIFENKKSKQRYLDYAFKIALKKAFERLVTDKIIDPSKVKILNVYVDEHTTATNGRYELKEALEQEFKFGTFNYSYNTFFEPIFKNLDSVALSYCDSKAKTLIRAADIIANKIYYHATKNDSSIFQKQNMYLIKLP